MSESKNEIDHPDIKKEQPLYRAFLTAISVAVVNVYLAKYFKMSGPKMLPWYIVSATIYTAGRIADRVSTYRVIDSITKAKEIGFEPNIEELNPNLPDQPSRESYRNHRKTIIDACYLATGLIFPPNAIALGIGSFLVAIHNEKLRAKIEKEIILLK